MPEFRYKVIDHQGQPIKGLLTADDEESLLKKLAGRGYSVISIKENKGLNLPSFKNIFFYRLSLNAFINFLRQFSTLIKAGLPLFESLTILIEQESDSNFKKILDDVRHSCAEGHSLAASFAKHPKIFSEFFINMVVVGEASGDLLGALDRVLKFAEEEREIRNNIVNALIYPVILVFAGFFIIIAILVFVLPQFVVIFESAEITLPLPTLILIWLSNFIKTKYVYLLLTLAAVLWGFRSANKTPGGKRFFDELKIKIPLLGPLVKKMIISRMTRVLGNLDESGVPLLKALEITQRTVGNLVVAKALDGVIGSVRDGKGIALPLKNSGLFPPMVVAMIAVGEESGYLEKMLKDVADFYERETYYTIRQLVALIEPMMLIAIGIAVSIIAASFLLPMFRMTALLRRK